MPLVYSMSRYRLGCVCKYKGQSVSACGVFNYQSANDEFNSLIAAINDAREAFYQKLAQESSLELKLLMRENDFYNWEHPSLIIKLNNFV